MHTEIQNALLGAMIGLVRAVSKNGKTENTDKLLASGIEAIRAGKETSALCEAIREEKFMVVPNCRYCAMPCGSTADADMESIWNAREAVFEAKEANLECLLRSEWSAEREDKLYFLHKGLFILGEDESPEGLLSVLEEMK